MPGWQSSDVCGLVFHHNQKARVVRENEVKTDKERDGITPEEDHVISCEVILPKSQTGLNLIRPLNSTPNLPMARQKAGPTDTMSEGKTVGASPENKSRGRGRARGRRWSYRVRGVMDRA